jgi:hypothetical protein
VKYKSIEKERLSKYNYNNRPVLFPDLLKQYNTMLSFVVVGDI